MTPPFLGCWKLRLPVTGAEMNVRKSHVVATLYLLLKFFWLPFLLWCCHMLYMLLIFRTYLVPFNKLRIMSGLTQLLRPQRSCSTTVSLFWTRWAMVDTAALSWGTKALILTSFFYLYPLKDLAVVLPVQLGFQGIFSFCQVLRLSNYSSHVCYRGKIEVYSTVLFSPRLRQMPLRNEYEQIRSAVFSCNDRETRVSWDHVLRSQIWTA